MVTTGGFKIPAALTAKITASVGLLIAALSRGEVTTSVLPLLFFFEKENDPRPRLRVCERLRLYCVKKKSN